jgi:hypothetical protein
VEDFCRRGRLEIGIIQSLPLFLFLTKSNDTQTTIIIKIPGGFGSNYAVIRVNYNFHAKFTVQVSVGDFDLLKLGIKGLFLVFFVDLGIWVLLGWGQISL